jgi:hypothetical protein
LDSCTASHFALLIAVVAWTSIFCALTADLHPSDGGPVASWDVSSVRLFAIVAVSIALVLAFVAATFVLLRDRRALEIQRQKAGVASRAKTAFMATMVRAGLAFILVLALLLVLLLACLASPLRFAGLYVLTLVHSHVAFCLRSAAACVVSRAADAAARHPGPDASTSIWL